MSQPSECTFYNKKDNQAMQCTACNHYCTIQNGKTGICGVRLNKNGILYLTVYSRPSATHVDPMEKKPMYHFYPGQQIYSIGTIGCNFKCDFCQNWDISMDRPGKDLEDICGQKKLVTPENIVQLCVKSNIKFISFTYNEPSIWAEYGLAISKLAQQQGIQIVYVSNGFMSQELREVLVKYISGINIDLKCFSESTYKQLMGGNLKCVCDNIRFFYENGVITEVTTLVIPNVNDSDEELNKTAQFLASVGKDIPWHVSAFHPDYKMQNNIRTPVATLEKAFQIGKQAGLINIYCGNERTDHTNTLCSGCKSTLINRSGHQAAIDDAFNGKCGKCGQILYGKF